MTLILVLGNRDQVIQISDRRHTVGSRITDDERNKATIMACLDGRFAVGFTGLAETGSFDTQRWIVESLGECGPSCFTAGNIVTRLRDKATKDFRSHPVLRRVARRDKRLSIIISGYLDRSDPPRCAYALITNYQDVDTKRDSPECWDEFRAIFFREKWPEDRPLHDISFVQRIGCWPAWHQADESTLRPMLSQRKPAEAIALKAYTVVHHIARRPQAGTSIGPQLTCITIPQDGRKSFGFDYDTSISTNVLPGPDFVFLTPAGTSLMCGFIFEKDASIGPGPHRPMVVPRVRQDQICPCGSGKRYKKCHGLRGIWGR